MLTDTDLRMKELLERMSRTTRTVGSVSCLFLVGLVGISEFNPLTVKLLAGDLRTAQCTWTPLRMATLFLESLGRQWGMI